MEVIKEMMKVRPRGFSMRPSMPDRKNSGRKLAMMIKVELSIGILTSFDASYTTSRTSLPRDCRSRLKTFSTSTMESSTSEPIAMAIPPRLIVLTVSPMNFETRRVTRIDSGIETKEMRVVLQFMRNMKRTKTTNMPPSMRDFLTLEIEPSMKRDWRNISELTLTSEGRDALISSRALSSFLVSSRLFVFGCFVTVSTTAGLPSLEARPRTGVLVPVFTSAMASKVTGIPVAEVFTTAFFISSTSEVERTPRTMYSFPYSYSVPPAAFWFIPLTA